MNQDDLAKAEALYSGSTNKDDVPEIDTIDTWPLIEARIPSIGQIFTNHLIYLQFADGKFAEVMFGELPSVDKEVTIYDTPKEFCEAVGYVSWQEFLNIGVNDVTLSELGKAIKAQAPKVVKVMLHKI